MKKYYDSEYFPSGGGSAKQKTAMQELIEWFDKNRLEIILNIDTLRNKAVELLPQERQQIINHGAFCAKRIKWEDAIEISEEEYTQTYEQ